MLLYPTREKKVGDYYPQRAIAFVASFLIAAVTLIPLAPVFAQGVNPSETTSIDQSASTSLQSDLQSSAASITDQSSGSDIASSTSIIVPTSTLSSSGDSSSSVITESVNTDNSSTSLDQNQTSSLDIASDTSAITPISTSSSSVSDNPTPSSESLNADFSTASSSLTTSAASLENSYQKTGKFKKDNSLSEDAQLAAVRQHLINSGLPQEIINRVDAYKTAEQQGPKQPGFLTQITNLITGNTDTQKAQKKIEDLAKQQPFKVGTYSGPIHTASKDNYSQTFSNKQEESGGLLGKIINFFKTGTLKNLNFDNTKTTTPLSWLFGQKAIAASDNPSDYLAAGNEITFSQAIKDKADALNHDPLTILNFVRNNVTYIPYYGSKKGADATLIERAGNDTDKASLLIAMLRYSNIAARYRQVDAKMDIGTVTDLLGVHSANAAALVLSLEQIPYTLYTDNENNPLFFVIEHTYVEAYMSYGYSRGANMNDGGSSQWVPMDPSINAYYYEQPIDTVGRMISNGFTIQQFFDEYLSAGSSTLEPLDAFKAQATTALASGNTTSTYENALMRSYPKDQNLDFIPGTLPYDIAADLDTYAYILTSLRHTISFTVKDDQDNTVLSYAGYVSDFADKELLVTYTPASQTDQDTLNTFDTIYDVVPLLLVAVKPAITVNGTVVATGSASTTLGQAQSYTMEFDAPTRTIGDSINSSVAETINRNVITGNTDAIALDTDRVTPPELRPTQDTQTTSFINNQVLYKTGVDFLYRLQNTQGELASITGGDFTNTATRATIFNGIDVTYASSGAPYSFSWKGLRIDSSSKVSYFNRFNDNTNTHFKEFTAVFTLQASQEESNIFEDDFNVQSIATVKGLKLVSAGAFSGITLHKITSANESDIDSLSVSTTTKSVFHTAIETGKTVYTPSAQFTYNNWIGLVYITIDFNAGVAGYTIGEGLNGGYTVAEWSYSMGAFWQGQELENAVAEIIHPTPNQQFQKGQLVLWEANYSGNVSSSSVEWSDTILFDSSNWDTGTHVIYSGYGTTSSVSVVINDTSKIGSILPEYDNVIANLAGEYEIPRGILKAIIQKEQGGEGITKFNPRVSRYEPKRDFADFSGYDQNGLPNDPRPIPHENMTSTTPFSYYTLPGVNSRGQSVASGTKVSLLPTDYRTTLKDIPPEGWQVREIYITPHTGSYLTVADLYANDIAHNISGTRIKKQGWPSLGFPASYTGNFTPQFLISSSYGLGQVMYLEATGALNRQGQHVMKDGNSPYDIIYNAGLGVELAASILKSKFTGLVPNDDCAGWSQAIHAYNIDEQYLIDVCKFYKTYK